jgi:hypothetical protein
MRTNSVGGSERKETLLSCHVDGNPEPQVKKSSFSLVLQMGIRSRWEPRIPDRKVAVLTCSVAGNHNLKLERKLFTPVMY